MALVFVQIARHLYQIMTPKVTISTKERRRYIYGLSGGLLSVYWGPAGNTFGIPTLEKARYYGGKIRLRKS